MYFRGGVVWQLAVEFFLQESEDGAVADSSSSASSLVATGLTRPDQLEVLHLAPEIEPHFLRQTEVYDVLHSKDGDRTLCDVGGNDDLVFPALLLE